MSTRRKSCHLKADRCLGSWLVKPILKADVWILLTTIVFKKINLLQIASTFSFCRAGPCSCYAGALPLGPSLTHCSKSGPVHLAHKARYLGQDLVTRACLSTAYWVCCSQSPCAEGLGLLSSIHLTVGLELSIFCTNSHPARCASSHSQPLYWEGWGSRTDRQFKAWTTKWAHLIYRHFRSC